MLVKVSAIVMLAVALGACAGQAARETPSQAPASPSFQELRAQVQAHFASCTEVNGFDPKASDLGEQGLAPGERAWRDCAYEGVTRIMIPRTQFPELYQQLIAEDQAMTGLIDNGEMTRSERMKRIQELVGQIENAEIVRAIRSSPSMSELEQQRKAAEVREMVGALRGIAAGRGMGR